MPRRNYLLIFATVIVSLLCYRAADPMARSFAYAARTIQQRYVDHVDRQALWSAAVRGMLTQLGDPYSEYIDPQEAAELEKILSQEFAGIGIQVGPEPETGRPQVISPIVGSPAYKAGILAGDIITKIDDQSARDMSYSDAVARIHGKTGEPVKLTVERPGKSSPIEFPPIRREIIHVESILGDERDANGQWNFLLQEHPKIGYLRITNFGEHTVDEFKSALTKLQSLGVQGLILDLRDNPGGLLRPAAVGVCDLLLPSGTPIVSTRGRNDTTEHTYVAGGGQKFLDFPIVVLLNRFSASASEIVAACLQDNHRATIVGERSYGKGTVQNIIPLDDQGILKLTTAEYLRPSGHNINRRPGAKDTDEWGVVPDPNDAVKMSKEDQQTWAHWRRDRDIVQPSTSESANSAKAVSDNSSNWQSHDPPLHRAIELLESQIQSPATK